MADDDDYLAMMTGGLTAAGTPVPVSRPPDTPIVQMAEEAAAAAAAPAVGDAVVWANASAIVSSRYGRTLEQLQKGLARVLGTNEIVPAAIAALRFASRGALGEQAGPGHRGTWLNELRERITTADPTHGVTPNDAIHALIEYTQRELPDVRPAPAPGLFATPPPATHSSTAGTPPSAPPPHLVPPSGLPLPGLLAPPVPPDLTALFAQQAKVMRRADREEREMPDNVVDNRVSKMAAKYGRQAPTLATLVSPVKLRALEKALLTSMRIPHHKALTPSQMVADTDERGFSTPKAKKSKRPGDESSDEEVLVAAAADRDKYLDRLQVYADSILRRRDRRAAARREHLRRRDRPVLRRQGREEPHHSRGSVDERGRGRPLAGPGQRQYQQDDDGCSRALVRGVPRHDGGCPQGHRCRHRRRTGLYHGSPVRRRGDARPHRGGGAPRRGGRSRGPCQEAGRHRQGEEGEEALAQVPRCQSSLCEPCPTHHHSYTASRSPGDRPPHRSTTGDRKFAAPRARPGPARSGIGAVALIRSVE